jgi:hypothetical protein
LGKIVRRLPALSSLPTLTSLTTLGSLPPLSLSVRHTGPMLRKEMEWRGWKRGMD